MILALVVTSFAGWLCTLIWFVLAARCASASQRWEEIAARWKASAHEWKVLAQQLEAQHGDPDHPRPRGPVDTHRPRRPTLVH